MSVFTNRGQAAKKSMNQNKQTIDLKKVYIRLKDGEAVRVRILSPEDYVEYLSHDAFNLGIYPQPCSKPSGDKCLLCEAHAESKKLDEDNKKKFEGLYAKRRYLFAFADIDSGEIRVWGAAKGQARTMIESIEEYAADLNDIAFTLKRTGSKTDTTYSLNPLLRLKPEDKAKFAKFDGATFEDEFFDTILQPRKLEWVMESLEKAGFPVELIGGSVTREQADDEVEEIQDDEDTDDIF